MLIELLIALVIVGAILFLVQRLPIDATIKTIIYVVVIVALCVYALRYVGELGVLG